MKKKFLGNKLIQNLFLAKKMLFLKRLFSKKNVLLIFSYHYPPDQSAGAKRMEVLANKLSQLYPLRKIIIFAGEPVRYNMNKKRLSSEFRSKLKSKNIYIKRFKTFYLGNGIVGTVISYSFYFIQALPLAILIRPEIIIGTTAKLLTGLLSSIAAISTGAKLYIDIRDTFTFNYFCLYKSNKRIIFLPLLSLIDKIIHHFSYSINLVSPGFEEIKFKNINLLKKNNTFFTNGIREDLKRKIEIECSKNIKKEVFNVSYAGNLGIGQDIYSLLCSIDKNEFIKNSMKNNLIKIKIYGDGAQSKQIKELLNNKSNTGKKKNKVPITDVVEYFNFLPINKLIKIYSESNCLMLQLADKKSLQYVIPSKIFEYAATNKPIIHGSKGYTKKFISYIDGTVNYKSCDAESFYKSILTVKNLEICKFKRKKFLDGFLIEKIMERYCKFIINNQI